MNKKALKIAGVIAIILGTIALYISGATESAITGIVSAVVVVIIAVLAIFKNEIGSAASKAKDKLEAVEKAIK